ncbi:putative kinesin K39, partial [Planoprotostelium fungivorum]
MSHCPKCCQLRTLADLYRSYCRVLSYLSDGYIRVVNVGSCGNSQNFSTITYPVTKSNELKLPGKQERFYSPLSLYGTVDMIWPQTDEVDPSRSNSSMLTKIERLPVIEKSKAGRIREEEQKQQVQMNKMLTNETLTWVTLLYWGSLSILLDSEIRNSSQLRADQSTLTSEGLEAMWRLPTSCFCPREIPTVQEAARPLAFVECRLARFRYLQLSAKTRFLHLEGNFAFCFSFTKTNNMQATVFTLVSLFVYLLLNVVLRVVESFTNVQSARLNNSPDQKQSAFQKKLFQLLAYIRPSNEALEKIIEVLYRGQNPREEQDAAIRADIQKLHEKISRLEGLLEHKEKNEKALLTLCQEHETVNEGPHFGLTPSQKLSESHTTSEALRHEVETLISRSARLNNSPDQKQSALQKKLFQLLAYIRPSNEALEKIVQVLYRGQNPREEQDAAIRADIQKLHEKISRLEGLLEHKEKNEKALLTLCQEHETVNEGPHFGLTPSQKLSESHTTSEALRHEVETLLSQVEHLQKEADDLRETSRTTSLKSSEEFKIKQDELEKAQQELSTFKSIHHTDAVRHVEVVNALQSQLKKAQEDISNTKSSSVRLEEELKAEHAAELQKVQEELSKTKSDAKTCSDKHKEAIKVQVVRIKNARKITEMREAKLKSVQEEMSELKASSKASSARLNEELRRRDRDVIELEEKLAKCQTESQTCSAELQEALRKKEEDMVELREELSRIKVELEQASVKSTEEPETHIVEELHQPIRFNLCHPGGPTAKAPPGMKTKLKNLRTKVAEAENSIDIEVDAREQKTVDSVTEEKCGEELPARDAQTSAVEVKNDGQEKKVEEETAARQAQAAPVEVEEKMAEVQAAPVEVEEKKDELQNAQEDHERTVERTQNDSQLPEKVPLASDEKEVQDDSTENPATVTLQETPEETKSIASDAVQDASQVEEKAVAQPEKALSATPAESSVTVARDDQPQQNAQKQTSTCQPPLVRPVATIPSFSAAPTPAKKEEVQSAVAMDTETSCVVTAEETSPVSMDTSVSAAPVPHTLPVPMDTSIVAAPAPYTPVSMDISSPADQLPATESVTMDTSMPANCPTEDMETDAQTPVTMETDPSVAATEAPMETSTTIETSTSTPTAAFVDRTTTPAPVSRKRILEPDVDADLTNVAKHSKLGNPTEAPVQSIRNKRRLEASMDDDVDLITSATKIFKLSDLSDLLSASATTAVVNPHLQPEPQIIFHYALGELRSQSTP